MQEIPYIYLIDGTAYIYRAYHAIRNLSTRQGFPTNAIFGFTQMLLKLINDKAPQYAAMVFDSKEPTFRHEIYTEYKANRPPMAEDMAIQIPPIKEIVNAFQIPVLELPGFEADDIIGTLAQKAEKENYKVILVTGDKDFKQLITPYISIWDPMKDIWFTYESQKAMPIHPEQYIDFLALSGDSADNIPGVAGIGPKTAEQLIEKFHSLKELYGRIEEIPQPKLRAKLIDQKENAFLSQKLVTIHTSVPIDTHPEGLFLQPPNSEKLVELFKKYEFRQLAVTFSKNIKTDLNDKKYLPIFSIEALQEQVAQIREKKIVAIDTETTSLHPTQATLVGISFSIEPHVAYYIPCGHTGEDAKNQLSLAEVRQILGPVFADSSIRKIGQNIKYDLIVLERHGFTIQNISFDTMIASYLLNPGIRSHGLNQIASDYLNHTMILYKDVVGSGKSEIGFEAVPLKQAVPYACEDADVTLQVQQVLAPKLVEEGLEHVFTKIEMPLIAVLKKMETTGICIDTEQLLVLSEFFTNQLHDLEKDIYKEAKESFNIKSSQQLGVILFEKLGLSPIKKTKKKSGYSTDVDVLEQLADKHALPKLILQHRTLAKLKSTYADALLELISPNTGRIHTSFNQTVTFTGRLSSSDPNLQNIPIRSEYGRDIRKAFIPEKGWKIISADYSQVELRLLAHFSQDPILLKSFLNDEDIHIRTASEVFHIFPEMITEDIRRQAKTINFGIIYGMSAFGLSKQLNISQKMAKTYIDNYFARYKNVQKYMNNAIEQARREKKTRTLTGRIRPLPDIDSPNATIRAFAERTAINTPLQGTAADLIKLAMIACNKALEEGEYKARLLLSVHDELVFEVPPEEVAAVSELIRKEMEHVWELEIPLKVHVGVGENWAQAH